MHKRQTTLRLSASTGAEALPNLSADDAQLLRQLFKDTVTEVSRDNAGRKAWWYTWIASRDRFNARSWDRLIWLARLKKLVSGPDLLRAVHCPDPIVARGAAAIGCGAPGNLLDRAAWVWRGAVIALQSHSRLLKQFAWCAAWIWYARRWPVAAEDRGGASVILVTLFEEASLRQAPYTDVYFGTLAEVLENAGERVLLCGSLYGAPKSITRAVHAAPDHPSKTTLAHYLTFGDLYRAFCEAIFAVFQPPRPAPGMAGALMEFIAEDARRSRADVLLGVAIRRATDRLLVRHPSARVIHIYENNPWEHAVDHAARAAVPPRHVTGYLHCAVLASHFKNYIAEGERAFRPAPDRIVCTGPAARDVFLGLGQHRAAEVVSGCALRDQKLRHLPARCAAPKAERILVILEGLTSMVTLLHFLAEAAPLLPGSRIRLRGHPALPLSRLLDLALMELGTGLEASTERDLASDLVWADVVIYQGTTASMHALLAGIPLVKVRLDETLEDDPLFACPHLKRVVTRPEELPAAIQDLSGMESATFDRELAQAQDYVRRYLASPEADSLQGFSAPASTTA